MSQTTYNFNPAIARHGMVAEARESNIIVSKLAEVAVNVGMYVSPGTDGQQGPPATTAGVLSASPGSIIPLAEAESISDTVFAGVPIYDSSRPPYSSTDTYAVNDPVPCMRKGVMWIKVDDAAVTQYGAVYVWADPDGDTTYTLGQFLAGANSGKALLFTRGQWLTSCAQHGLAVLEIW